MIHVLSRGSSKATPNTAKIHSRLFRSVALKNLAKQRDQKTDRDLKGLLKSQAEKLSHERWVKKKVRLGPEYDIHRVRKREVKKLRVAPAASPPQKNLQAVPDIVNKPPSACDTSDVTAAKMAMMAPSEEEYKETQISNILMCQDCREIPPNLVEEFSSGDMVCASCGLVVRETLRLRELLSVLTSKQVGDKIVDTRSEWRTFANDDQNNDDPSRVGDVGNPLFEDTVATLQTSIGREGSNSFHLMKTQAKTIEKGAANQKEGFNKIKILADTLQVGTTVRDYALHIFKRMCCPWM